MTCSGEKHIILSMKKAFQKIPKPIRTVLFYALQWTWGLPQNLFGALAALVLKGRRFRYHDALVTLYKPVSFMSNRYGFSLGMFIFMPEGWPESAQKRLVVHEYGHTVQSLIIGPFYLPAVGLPSVLWSKRYSRRNDRYVTRGVSYTDRYPENWADRAGEYATGEKPY